jgi:hypothetical protein
LSLVQSFQQSRNPKPLDPANRLSMQFRSDFGAELTDPSLPRPVNQHETGGGATARIGRAFLQMVDAHWRKSFNERAGHSFYR